MSNIVMSHRDRSGWHIKASVWQLLFYKSDLEGPDQILEISSLNKIFPIEKKLILSVLLQTLEHDFNFAGQSEYLDSGIRIGN